MKKQFSAPDTIKINRDAFSGKERTSIYWLGSAGVLINSRGTCIMIDPVLESMENDINISETGYRYLVPPPISCEEMPMLDAVLYTHADTDHMAPKTSKALFRFGMNFYGTDFTCLRLREDFGIENGWLVGMNYNDVYQIGNIQVKLTHCNHNWRADLPEDEWKYGEDDCCGFYITTADGTVWIPGDSILEQYHFEVGEPDVMFLDFSADKYHFGTENAVKLANHYRNSELLLYHYGTYDAPDHTAFNADPAWLDGKIDNPERIRMLAPGKEYVLNK